MRRTLVPQPLAGRTLVPWLLTSTLVALGAGVAAPALAAPDDPALLPVAGVTLPTSGRAFGPQLVVDQTGRVTLGVQGMSSNPSGRYTGVMSRSAGAAAFDPGQLLPCATECLSRALATNDAGDTVIAWLEDPTQTGPRTVWAATRARDEAAFGAPVRVGTSSGDPYRDGHIQAAVSPAGDITVTWFDEYALTDHGKVRAATLPAGGTPWSAPTDVPGSTDATGPAQLDVDAAGQLTLAWPTPGGLEVATGSTGTFHAPVTVSTDGPVSALAMDVNDEGRLGLAWVSTQRLSVATRTKGAAMSVPAVVSPAEAGLKASAPVVAVAPDGTLKALVALDRAAPGQDSIHLATLPADGSQPVDKPLYVASSGGHSLVSAEIVVADDGAFTAAWGVWTGSNAGQLRYSHGRPGADLAAPVVVSETDGSTPGLVVDPGGDVTMVWATFAGLRSRVLDVAGPTISSATAPSSVVAGSPASFSVSAADQWSGPATYAWDFGDGTTGSGAAPQHTYAKVGSYPVTVTAIDAVGHRSTQAVGSVQVTSMYAFSGLLAPVDAAPVWNTTKAGNGIPLKFTLGGNRGLGVLAGSPTSAQVACTSGPSDQLETTVSSLKPGLTYDSRSATYTYAWPTTKSMAGTCRTVTLTLSDGTTQTVNVKLTS